MNQKNKDYPMIKAEKDEDVLVAVKTPLMPKATTAFLPANLTVAESLNEIQKIPPKDADAKRVLLQLKRETSGVYHVLITNQGITTKVDPSTQLGKIAEPREVRTPNGLEMIPSTKVEVQAYAPVGVEKL